MSTAIIEAARQPAPAGESLAPLRSATGAAVIAATVFASGVASYDAYVVNVAVPAITRHFGAGVAAIQWTLTSYLLAVAALLLVAGVLADRFGAGGFSSSASWSWAWRRCCARSRRRSRR